jgi:ribonuclease BN (tRNA processing enzyme)
MSFSAAITDCTIKDCMKFFIEPDKMKIEFNIQNIADYYIDANITAEYNNKTVKICTLPFWKPSNDKRCKVVKNSTSGDFSIIVSNATPFKKLESKVMLKFYKTGHCIQDNKDHYVTVEAVYGG